jgi:pimeloyl-ACP methyl ester carboxylesterase
MRALPLALALALVPVAACGDDGGNGGSADATVARPDASVDAGSTDVPRVQPTSCRFQVPSPLGSEGIDYDCGDLFVYENRGLQRGVIRVHFLRFPSSAGSADATVYLDGGPGGNGSSLVSWLNYRPELLPGLLANGDLLIIAQRGTSLSDPSLLCDSVTDCLTTTGDTVDLPSFNSAYNADDVDDLRATLGYERLNLYGISYGSRLGLEILRRHPDNIRSAVLGGLVPASIDWLAHVPSSFYSGLTALDADCAADAGCAAAFSDLEGDFLAGVDTLNSAPVSFTYDGQPLDLDGATYASTLFSLLYSRSAYPWLPLVIHDLADRRTDRVVDFLGPVLADMRESSIAYGLYTAIVCGELFNPPDDDAPGDANAAVPTAIRDLFGGTWSWYREECTSWPKHTLANPLRQPVAFDGPVLLASGRMDPITPPTFGDVAAATLPAAVHVVYEGSGHGSTLQSPCGNQNLVDFFADPTGAVDASCAAALSVDYVLPGAATARRVPRDQLRLELERAPLPPPIRDQLRRARAGN